MIAARVAELTGRSVTAVSAVAGGDICDAYRVDTPQGSLFVKSHRAPPRGLFHAEAAGLRWLADAPGGVAVPRVVAAAEDLLVLEWLHATDPSRAAAVAFGRALAATHAAGADRFGAPWQGYVGTLAVVNDPVDEWPALYGAQRLLPALEAAGSAVTGTCRALVRRVAAELPALAGPAEPPARIHGDLWAGNVVWTDRGACLVDPAAHGGHRETDLAMLALFGAPHLSAIVAAYDAAFPLAAGWRDRTALHQLHPLLVHAALFGASWGARAEQAARDALQAGGG